ncbi:MAG TPA: sigma-70 family RNA polymerase sigma factor [Candidatus Limnocylindrales bacterium]|nr:sigma-70 family RNA polymerase sigma factor [Candidatus Limnocylindrales bacterium]
MDATTDIDELVVDTMQRHGPGLERYVRSLVHDADEAADVVQETEVRLLLTARADGIPASPGAWMARVAHNLVVSSARRRQTAARRADRLVEWGEARSTEDTIVRRERDAEVIRALAAARSDDRDAIVLAASGYGTAEIAERLGRSELATRALLCRARGRVRESLAATDAA